MRTLQLNVINGTEVPTREIPTSVKDIKSSWLLDVTSKITVAPNYSLIALISKDTLFYLLNSKKKKSDGVVGVIPVFVKCGDCDSAFINNIETNTPIIISAGDISIGYHVHSKDNTISPTAVYNFCQQDTSIYQNVIGDSSPIYLVDFKIVPNSAIKGCYNKEDRD